MADEVEKIVFVPSGTEKFSPQRSLGVWVMSCNIECKSPQDGEVCGGVVFAVSRRVFVERDIQGPMQAILDVPVAAADGKQSFWAHFLGEKKVALERLLLAALTDDTANRGKAWEIPNQPDDASGNDGCDPLFLPVVTVLVCRRRLGARPGRNGGFGIAQKRGLIAFDRQGIISTTRKDRFGEAAMAVQRIGRHHTAFQVQHLEQQQGGLGFVSPCCLGTCQHHAGWPHQKP